MSLLNLFKNTPVERDWVLISKSYAPPRKEITVQLPEEVQQKALFGVTTYIFQDSLTGEIKKEEILGSDESQWNDIVDKVEKFGMQYIKHGESVYAVAKWVPPTDSSIPLR